jgi:hypothetical protein
MMLAVVDVTGQMDETQLFPCNTNFGLPELMLVKYLAGLFAVPGYGILREPIS